MTGLYPDVFDIRWIYPFSMLSILGGGAIGYAAMSYLVAGSITSADNRYVRAEVAAFYSVSCVCSHAS